MNEEADEIIDGVRRAKSYELLGKPAIPAEIINEEGNTVGRRDVPIDSLRVTTKKSIDVSTQKEWERFMKTFNEVKSGSPTPPILITPGDKGQKIRDIQLDPTGEAS
ncbi:MAG: hypothetical protein MOB07_02310 [Acidobacteria bacterium]|nr:hypothetical protein [Acidobacteriota bacterium]